MPVEEDKSGKKKNKTKRKGTIPKEIHRAKKLYHMRILKRVVNRAVKMERRED